MDTLKIANGNFLYSFSLNSLEQDWMKYFGKSKRALYGFLSAELEGEFLLFERGQLGLTITRDAMGVIPAYYYWLNGRLFVSNSISLLANSHPGLNANTTYFEKFKTWDFSNMIDTPFKEIFRLPPWHQVKLTAEAHQIQRYGSLLDQVAHPQQSLQDLISQAFSQRVEDRSTLLVSGGFDSSSLHFLAENLQLPTESFCVDFSSYPAKEEKGLSTLARFSRRPVHRLVFDEFRNEIPNQKSWPILKACNPAHAFYTPILKKSVEGKYSLVITGLGGDDVFTAPVSHYLWQNKFRLSAWRELVWHERFSAIKGIIRHAIRKILPDRFLKRIHPKHVTYKKLNLYQIALLERFELGGGYTYGMETEQEYAQHFGLRMSFPLLDLRIVRWAFQNSDVRSTSWMIAKPQLRESMKNLVPDEIRNVRSLQDMSAEFLSLADTSASHRGITDFIMKSYQKRISDFLNKGKNPHVTIQDSQI